MSEYGERIRREVEYPIVVQSDLLKEILHDARLADIFQILEDYTDEEKGILSVPLILSDSTDMKLNYFGPYGLKARIKMVIGALEVLMMSAKGRERELLGKYIPFILEKHITSVSRSFLGRTQNLILRNIMVEELRRGQTGGGGFLSGFRRLLNR